MPLLEVTQLTTEIGDPHRPATVVAAADLTLEAGETLALLGESGCGKSMLALSLMRLLPPSGRITAGTVSLESVDLLTLPERDMRRFRGGGLAMIFQEPMTSLNPVLTIGQQIGEAIALHDPNAGRRAALIEARGQALLAAVGLPDPAGRLRAYPHQLSGGMKQRAMIALALAGHPRLLIADEPTTALDVTIQAQVLDLLRQLQREQGLGMLLITHDLGVVAETAQRVAVMYAGQIVETAPVQGFFSHPRHPYSRKLFEALPQAGRRDHRLAVIPGWVPPLDQPFSGCRFADRCEWVVPLCRHTPPLWQPLSGNCGVRCHRYAEIPVLTAETRASGHTHHPLIEPPILEVRGLAVHFPIRRGILQRTVGHVRAVDRVDLTLAPGRTLALVGESGCGKTTAGKAILRLIAATAGTVRFQDTDLAQLSGRRLRQRRAAMQIIFQDPAASLDPRFRVHDIVAEGLRAQGRVIADLPAHVGALLEQVGLPAAAQDRYPHEFSGGQRQRICIARALAVEPRLIVCDEPTSALDLSVQAQILNLLKDLQDRLGLAYLFITHNLPVVGYLAHEVAVLYLGRIVEQGPVDRVLNAPSHPYTQALLSAAPNHHPGVPFQRITLAGDPPSPAAPPTGCHFHPRCPQAIVRCSQDDPPEVTLGPHRYRCWLGVS
ncbi:MAG: ABC transporter ATP-binding protein [Pseudomonadota bacterium]